MNEHEPHEDRDKWRQEWRDQWAAQTAQTERLIQALEGGTMSALDDLISAVSGNQAVSERIATLVDTLQDQVGQLQTTVDELIAAGNPDLGPVTAQIQAITDQLVAAEAPNVEEEEVPEEEVPAEEG